MPPPPIILIHRGDSFYLAHCIAQARSSNPDSRLILLGDRSNIFYIGVEHHCYEDHFNSARLFQKLFTYKYFPSYQYPWILFCHQKYFALRDFIHSTGIEKFLLIDSDVMIYEPISSYFEYYSSYQLTLSRSPGAVSAQAAFAIVNSPEIIGMLCSIYEELFRASPEALKARFGTDYFTEMIGLALLMLASSVRIKNTYEENHDFVVSHNLTEDDRFTKHDGFSQIFWQGNLPTFHHKSTGRIVKSPIIHFHGRAKKQMGKNTKLNGPQERMEWALNRALSALAKYPMRAANRIAGRPIFPGL
jgi:hypothetical protein